MYRLLALTILLWCTASVHGQDPAEFQNPSPKFRPTPLWFWNNTALNPDSIATQLSAFKTQCGYGGVSILPFGVNLAPKYLGEAYFDLYKYTATLADSLGMTLSLYDEYGFPSGSGGAINADGIPRFQNRYPDLTLKRLDKHETPLQGAKSYTLPVTQPGVLMALVAFNPQSGARLNLKPQLQGDTLHWDAPQGEWLLMEFRCVTDGDPNMDYLSREAAEAYIAMTHEAYFRRMPQLFGKTITSTFFDEPTLYRAQARCWTPSFNERFAQRFGTEPDLYYPALWYDIGSETTAARNALFSLRAELYAEAYPKAVSAWSKAHGIEATGHQDNEEIENPVGTSADLMKCFKYQDIPGVDKIGGDRPAERFYKIISSAAYNWDHSLVMSETYGAMGDIPWNTLYNIAMDQYTKGINLLIPHAVWYNDRDVTFKPELSHRNPLYREGLYAFNTFLARLNLLLRNDDRFCADLAMLYPIETLEGEHRFDGPLTAYQGGVKVPDMDYIQLSERLSNQLSRDFMFLHPEVLEEQGVVNKSALCLPKSHHNNRFRTLILPSCRVFSLHNLETIAALYRAGGTVIFTIQLPQQAVEFGKTEALQTLLRELFGGSLPTQTFSVGNKAGGRLLFLPQPSTAALRDALARADEPYDIEFSGAAPLRYIHKNHEGRDLYYLANLSTESYRSLVTLRGKHRFECWDPHTGVITPVASTYTRKGKYPVTQIELHLDPAHSLFLVERP
ncbi:MAG: glycosyl hydrolase [Alistipes sp.]|nr:glycosyl hydrolase [Alistipes sp.]